MQLRANGERAVLVGHDGVAEREMDPQRLPLGVELTDALHEWARVASAVRRSDANASGGSDAAGAVVTRRGLQLAGRVAASMGVPVGYVDPLSGQELVVEDGRIVEDGSPEELISEPSGGRFAQLHRRWLESLA